MITDTSNDVRSRRFFSVISERVFAHFFAASVLLVTILIASHFIGGENVPKATHNLDERYHPESGPLKFKVIRADGFLLDPMQAGFVDAEGYILATSPISYALSAWCKGGSEKVCFAYDEERGIIHEPDFASWERGDLFNEHRYPQNKPFGTSRESGFVTRQAEISERLWFDVASISTAPIWTLFGILWWLPVWYLIAGIIRRLKGNDWRVRQMNGETMLSILLKIVAIAALSGITSLYYIFSSYSHFRFLFLFVSAGMFVALSKRRYWSDI